MALLTNNPITREMNKERVFGLDILRAVAIFYVLIGHGALFMPLKFQMLLTPIIPLDAVTLFFVLSGFLIGKILIKTFEKQEVTLRTLTRFWGRRWLRTLPAYLTVLFAIIMIYPSQGKRVVLKYLLFLQNFNQPIREWFTESWSLSIEEWFYLLTPVVLFTAIKVFKMPQRKAFLITTLSFIIAFPLYRLFKYYYQVPLPLDHRSWDFLFRMQVLTRLDSIMYGVFAAYIYRYYPAVWQKNKKSRALLGLAILVVARAAIYYYAFREGVYSSVFSFCVESIGVLLLMPYFEGIKKGRGVLARAVTFTAIISYSLYLVNLAIVALWMVQILPHFGLEGAAYHAYRYVFYLVATVGLSTLLYLCVEYPFLQWRDRHIRDTALGKNREKATVVVPQPLKVEPIAIIEEEAVITASLP